MSAKTKVGRNDPCPCGSGKKYKKCCEPLDEVRALGIPPEELTGTPLDKYLLLLPAVGLFAEGIRRFDPDGKEFARTVRKFEESFHPGEDGKIPDSVFMSWQFFDLRFGKSRKTVCERLLESPSSAPLAEEGRKALLDLSATYCGFYEVRGKTSGVLVLGELFDGSERRADRLHEPYEDEIRPGEILFTRLVGPPDRAYLLTTPCFFEAEDRPHFRDMLEFQRDTYLSELGLSEMSAEALRRESYKAMLPTWLRLIDESADEERFAANPRGAGTGPGVGTVAQAVTAGRKAAVSEGRKSRETKKRNEESGDLVIVNTDGDKVCLTNTRFKIADARAVRSNLSAAADFAHDENAGEWIWEKKDESNWVGGRDLEGRTVIGTVFIKGEFLVAETNSLERALQLRGRLEEILGGAIAFRSMRSRDLADIPPPSPEERERLATEREELNARPEIRDMLGRMLENYYLKKWPEAKIPALGGRTPREAMETGEGRRGVERLLGEIEAMEKAKKPASVGFDFDRVRMKLGLPPRKQ
jgi:hypothetical protein